jgi:secondary thiamine-phosphate synthase enzyme
LHRTRLIRGIPRLSRHALREDTHFVSHVQYEEAAGNHRHHDEVEECRAAAGITEGFVLVSAMHISASVFVNDHEPGLWKDILDWLENRIAPWSPDDYRHNSGTGEENAAAHLRSITIGHEVIVPVTKGKLDFGPWQRVFYGEWDGKRRSA